MTIRVYISKIKIDPNKISFLFFIFSLSNRKFRIGLPRPLLFAFQTEQLL